MGEFLKMFFALLYFLVFSSVSANKLVENAVGCQACDLDIFKGYDNATKVAPYVSGDGYGTDICSYLQKIGCFSNKERCDWELVADHPDNTSTVLVSRVGKPATLKKLVCRGSEHFEVEGRQITQIYCQKSNCENFVHELKLMTFEELVKY